MRAHFLFALMMLASAASATAHAGQPSVRDEIESASFKLIFDSTAIANLTFQLDCMANLIHCDSNAVLPLWKTAAWTADDAAAIQAWGELQEKYSGFEVALPEVSSERQREIGYPLRHRGVAFDQRIRIIEFTASDAAEFRKGIGILMRADDADKAVSIVRRFEPRFNSWWKKTGAPMAESFVGSFAGMMKKDGLTNILEKSIVFYRAHLPASAEVYVHFIALPAKSGHTSGEQIENHGVVEFLASEKPEDRIDVICHEVFHYFYSMASTQDHAALVTYFVKSAAPYGIPAYNLLNEALATAFGNGMVARATHSAEWFQKVLSKTKSFYSDYPIDTVAKKILPELDQDLGTQVTLYDQAFLSRYLQSTGAALAGESTSPQLFLRTSTSFYEKAFQANYRDFQKKIHSGSTWDNTDSDSDYVQNKLLASPRLSALLMLRPSSTLVLDRWKVLIPASKIAEIKRASKQKKSFIYAVKRARNAWIYVLVAPAGDAASTLLTKFAGLKSAFAGFMP